MRIMAMLFLAAACVSPASETSSPAEPTTTGELALYLTGSFNGAGLVAVDPLTLQDRSAKALLPINATSANNSWTAASLDGSTVAVMNYHYRTPVVARDLDITVFDARTGARRAGFNPEVPVIVDALSPDGARIYARNWPPRDTTAERLVLDASSGRIIEREPAFAVGGDTIAVTTDERARRQYRVVGPADTDATGPRPVDLAGWDLRTGKALWRFGLPSLLAGEWKTGRIVDGVEIRSRVVPGVALSPDGRRIAVVGGSVGTSRTGTVWLIDAHTGALISQRNYNLAASFFERLFAPSIAMAKSLDESVIVNASFSTDGQLLHVYGHSSTIDARGEPTRLYLGMVAVAMQDATIRGHDIKMEIYWYENRVEWIRASPDGRWLYLFVQRNWNATPQGYFLRRLDASTLRVQAERPFDGYRQHFLLATR
jgi:hypothetical protein